MSRTKESSGYSRNLRDPGNKKNNPLTPRFIFQSGDKWLWQKNSDTQVDITNRKFYWNHNGKQYYMSIPDWNTFSDNNIS